jgi:hypothetical protein
LPPDIFSFSALFFFKKKNILLSFGVEDPMLDIALFAGGLLPLYTIVGM